MTELLEAQKIRDEKKRENQFIDMMASLINNHDYVAAPIIVMPMTGKEWTTFLKKYHKKGKNNGP